MDDERFDKILSWVGLVTICLGDWGAAASHMAFDTLVFKAGYAHQLPVFGDVWHLTAGLRYLPMGFLAVFCFTREWKWWAATAVVDWAGWQILKILHNKDWGWGVWERWL